MLSKLSAAMLGATFLFAATDSQAYDGRHDRGGLLFGGELGVDFSYGHEGDTSDEFKGGNPEFHGAIRFGGGLRNAPLTFDLSLGGNYGTWDDASRQTISYLIGANYFFGDFYLRFAFGAASIMYNNANELKYGDLEFKDKTYMAGEIGLGYEFFVNSDLALGLKANCLSVDLNEQLSPGLSFTLTWY